MVYLPHTQQTGTVHTVGNTYINKGGSQDGN